MGHQLRRRHKVLVSVGLKYISFLLGMIDDRTDRLYIGDLRYFSVLRRATSRYGYRVDKSSGGKCILTLSDSVSFPDSLDIRPLN